MTGKSDCEFTTHLINLAKLPHDEIVKAQLTWILEAAKSPCVIPAPYVAGGHKTLHEMAHDVHKALLLIRNATVKLSRWSEGVDQESAFYRTAIRSALDDSNLVPDEMVKRDNGAHWARRVEHLLPLVSDDVLREILRIKHYTAKSSGRVQFDPHERIIVQLLWLVFEVSGVQVSLEKRGSATPSRFQRVCVDLFAGAGSVTPSMTGRKPRSLSNLANRVRDHIEAGHSCKRLEGIKAVMTTEPPCRVQFVPTLMSVWIDWLMGCPIPQVTSSRQEKTHASRGRAPTR